MAAVSRIPRPPLALAVGLAALMCFGLALLVGWLTAGTKEDLRRAPVVHGTAAVQAIPPLRAAAPLPPPPPKRPASASRPNIVVPKVIVGSG